MIENSIELHEQFQNFTQDTNKSILITVIDVRLTQQRLHIPFVRQFIDKTDLTCSTLSKYFIILMHSSGQELDHQSCFPSIFLHDWDYWFIDTCTPGSAFHLQKMLQIFTSKLVSSTQREPSDNSLYDLNLLFDDCLWDFSTRLQVYSNQLSNDNFQRQQILEFYQRQTNTNRRVQCLKEILEQENQLKTRLVSIYHENVSMKEESFYKNCHLIYQISKDTLCGKNYSGLVDSLQSKIRTSFSNFVSNVLKFIVDDFGLETLTRSSNTDIQYSTLLDLIDYSSFIVNQDDQYVPIIQGTFVVNNNYSCILKTPFFHLLRQRIKTLADQIKQRLAQQQSNGLFHFLTQINIIEKRKFFFLC